MNTFLFFAEKNVGKNISGENIFDENIFAKNICAKNISTKNIFFCMGKGLYYSPPTQLPPPLTSYLKLRGGDEEGRTYGQDGAHNDCSFYCIR